MSQEQQIAWAAGLFEGEGSAYVSKRGEPRLDLMMTDRDTVERFAAVVGGSVRGPHRRGQERKDVYQWTCCRSGELVRVGEMLLPWLSKRRHGQVTSVINRAGEIRPRTLRGKRAGSCGRLPPGAVTGSGYKHHLAYGESPCENCLAAHRDYCRLRRQR